RTDADHGYWSRRIPCAFPQREGGYLPMNFKEIAEFILPSSRAEDTEVLAMQQDESLTRFANNFIHQNVTERNVQVTVRSVLGTKVGIAVSNDVQPERLRSLAVRAREAASLQPENPEFKGLPSPQKLAAVSAFDLNVA